MLRIIELYCPARVLRGVLMDASLVVLALAIGLSLRADALRDAVAVAGVHAASLAAGLFVYATVSSDASLPGPQSVFRSLARALFGLAMALPVTFAVFSQLPLQVDTLEVVQWSALIGVSAAVFRRVYSSHGGAASRAGTRVIVFGSGSTAADVGRTLTQSDPDINILGYVPGPNEGEPAVAADRILPRVGTLRDLARRHQADEIVVALTERRAGSMPLRELLDCKLSGVKVYDISTHFEKTLGQISVEYLNAGWMIFGDGFNQGVWRTSVKRVFDVLCALFLLVLATPIMLVTALLIKLESRGPLLYKQERVGQNNATFNVVKFRSMRTDAEQDGKPRWATTNDDRVTRVGRFIRKTRIDELPQLFNVLSGEMSLVGPRPERPFFVEQLTQEIPYFAVRHSVKPGVTGWAQVRYPYGATVDDSRRKLQFDLFYVKNHSLLLDVLILIETVVVVLTARGAR